MVDTSIKILKGENKFAAHPAKFFMVSCRFLFLIPFEKSTNEALIAAFLQPEQF